ncbi:MAG: hypothetical protein ABIG92_02670 [Candidatus Omnitrophota bacterium]
MKNIISVLIILAFASPSFAMSIGGPDMSIPEKPLYTKDKAVNRELDKYEFNTNLRAGAEMELIFGRELEGAEADISKAELKGQNYMIKFSNNFNNIFEPYIKIGTSNLKAEWTQYGESIEVTGDPGFIWCMGAKAILADIKDYGVKVSFDMQHRSLDTKIDTAKRGGTTIGSMKDEEFTLKEWQFSLMASKKYIFPFKQEDYYVIPYGGITYSLTDVNVRFTEPSGREVSTYNADDKNDFGFVLGFDVMPSLSSWYLFNFEMKLINEFAITMGSTIKF